MNEKLRSQWPKHWKRTALTVHMRDEMRAALKKYCADFPYKVGESTVVEGWVREKLEAAGLLKKAK